MKYSIRSLAIALAITAPLSAPALAQIITSEVSFPRGSTGTTINSSIVGAQTRDYVVRVGTGQTLSVRIAGSPIVYFNILAPGSNDEAIFVGSSSGNSFSRTVSMPGSYKIRVYQMRATARRGERGAFRLSISATGRGGAGANSTAGIMGMDAIKAFDVMTARGFVNVDTLTAGDEIYGTYWKASTRECVQVNTRNNRVFGVEKVPHHPKCR